MNKSVRIFFYREMAEKIKLLNYKTMNLRPNERVIIYTEMLDLFVKEKSQYLKFLNINLNEFKIKPKGFCYFINLISIRNERSFLIRDLKELFSYKKNVKQNSYWDLGDKTDLEFYDKRIEVLEKCILLAKEANE